MNRAVFDTNILISAVISRNGSPFKCLAIARRGLVESITCVEILDEFREKLVDKLKRTPEQADALVEDVKGFSRIVAISGELKAVKADPDDDKIIECAVVGKATHVVTGDARHLLPLKAYRDISIISAADFVSLTADE